MSKLRMEKRRKVLAFTPVYKAKTKVLLGYLGDLTLKGALLISEKPIAVDRVLKLEIEFRKKSVTPAKRTPIDAVVAWCKQEEHKTYYNNGLVFLQLTPKDKKTIGAILEKYQFTRDVPF